MPHLVDLSGTCRHVDGLRDGTPDGDVDNFVGARGSVQSRRMTRRPTALPRSLRTAPFTVATARELGVERRRLLAADLQRPTRGVRTTRPARTIIERAAALSLVLPAGAIFSHETAAQLWGLPLPSRLVDGPLHVSTQGLGGVVRRSGVVGHRGAERKRRSEIFGLAVADGPDTWLDLATRLTRDELAQLGDAIVGNRPARIDDLRAVLGRRSGAKGLRTARAALELVRPGSRSPMETLCRLRITDAGLPDPELNVDVHDDNGQWIAQVDFCWRARKVVLEYDGEQHGEPRQRELDAQRRRQLTAAGWTVLVVTRRDLLRGSSDWLQDLCSLLAR